MKTLHIVPHVHWDREWYFTARESKIYFINHMNEILEHLENNADFKYYVLDGQTSILEDYFHGKPESFERVKKLVQSGRLIIGPWYTQTDTMLIHGESIARNLYYGYKDCSRFGGYMDIGYLPDSFGQSAQLPMIFNGFDIKYSVFWRGISERHKAGSSEFYWESDNGSKVLAQVLPLCYAAGRFLPNDEKSLKTRFDYTLKELFNASGNNDVILPNGHDQMPIQKDLVEIIEKLNKLYPDLEVKLNNYKDVMKIHEEKSNLKTICGEFLDAEIARVHRSIYSTRMDLKIFNTKLEHKLINDMEPIATMAHLLGFDYQHGLIENMWKELMKNHAHDSIGCCCSDEVHNQIEERFKVVDEESTNLMNFTMRLIAEHQEGGLKEKLLVFNTLPYKRRSIVEGIVTTKIFPFKLTDGNGDEIKYDLLETEDIDPSVVFRELRRFDENGNWIPYKKCRIKFIDELPSFGYKTYLIDECENQNEGLASCNEIEDDFFKIEVNNDGTLKILDKKDNLEYNKVCQIVDDGDDGDEYDYSPPEHDLEVSNSMHLDIVGKKGRSLQGLNISYMMNIPNNLESREKKLLDNIMNCKLNVELNNDGLIKLNVSIYNTADNHRVRMLFPTGINSKFSYANQPFGEIEREVIDVMDKVWEDKKWEERPDTIYPMLDYVYLKNEEKQFALISNGSREYEVVGDDFDTVALTLFRAIGYCGKSDLIRRPGRLSGIALPTPDSQMHKTIEFDFALGIFDNSKNVSKVAKEHLSQAITYNFKDVQHLKINQKANVTPITESFLQMELNDVTVSAIKKAENSDEVVVRVFNTNSNNERIAFVNYGGELKVCNLKEEVTGCINGDFVEGIKKNDTKTILVDIKNND